MTRRELTIGELCRDVYRDIAFAADRGRVAPTNAILAAKHGVALSTIWKAVKRLCDAGIVEYRKVHRPGTLGHKSAYRIVATAAETDGFSTCPPVRPPLPPIAQRREHRRNQALIELRAAVAAD